VARSAAAVTPWITAISSPGARLKAGELGEGRRGGRDVIAFEAGVAALPQRPDVVLKLDADVSFEPVFFEQLLAAFEADDSLGISGGLCYELVGGEWQAQHVTGDHVRGATRAYRWACWLDVSPLEQQLGWDGIDELKAELAGWTVRSLPDVPFLHHRRVGARDGARRAWEAQGATAYFMGYRFGYLLLRSLFQARKRPVAIAMIWGYLVAAAQRAPRYTDEAVVEHLRSKQALRRLAARAREARGNA
jgi:hypothetical protein